MNEEVNDEEYRFDEINDTSIATETENDIELTEKHNESTEAGRCIEIFKRNWENNGDKQPLMRGKVHCFGYYNIYNKNEPLITVGPDFKFSIAEIVMINTLLYIPMS